MSPANSHSLQLRLPVEVVEAIDIAILTIPVLAKFNRSRFIRSAILYSLDSLNETHPPESVDEAESAG